MAFTPRHGGKAGGGGGGGGVDLSVGGAPEGRNRTKETGRGTQRTSTAGWTERGGRGGDCDHKSQ